jgi:hypothetical protein
VLALTHAMKNARARRSRTFAIRAKLVNLDVASTFCPCTGCTALWPFLFEAGSQQRSARFGALLVGRSDLSGGTSGLFSGAPDKLGRNMPAAAMGCPTNLSKMNGMCSIDRPFRALARMLLK